MSAWISVTGSGKTPFAVPKYIIESANDAQSRDPASWILFGMKNASVGVELHRVEDHVFEGRNERHEFIVPAPFSEMKFDTFNFTFSAIRNSSKADCVQLSEIDIPSLPPPPAPEEGSRRCSVDDGVEDCGWGCRLASNAVIPLFVFLFFLLHFQCA